MYSRPIGAPRCIICDVNTVDLYRLARVLRDIALTVTTAPGAGSVSAGTMAIVRDVHGNPAAAIGDIAERTGLAQSLVSRTVARLRDKGVLMTAHDPKDGRRTLVSVRSGASIDAFLPHDVRSIDDGIRALLPDVTDVRLARILLGLNVLADEVLGAGVDLPADCRAL